MTFSDFVQKLHPIIGAGNNQSTFTKTLFEVSMTEESCEVLDSVKPSSFKAYFNGNTGISSIAKKVNPYFDSEAFVDYINHFQDAVRQNLCDSFSDEMEDINQHNVSDKLADLFLKIINEAASQKRKSTSKGTLQKDITIVPANTSDENVEENTHDNAEIADSITEFVDRKISEDVAKARSELNHAYYNLIVTNLDIFGCDYVEMDSDRIVLNFSASNTLIKGNENWSDSIIPSLIGLPTIICHENTDFRGETDENQIAIFARINRIVKRAAKARIYFEPTAFFKQTELVNKAFEFDLDVEHSLTTLNRTHWLLRNIDLFAVFDEIDIQFCNYRILYMNEIIARGNCEFYYRLHYFNLQQYGIDHISAEYARYYDVSFEENEIYKIVANCSFERIDDNEVNASIRFGCQTFTCKLDAGSFVSAAELTQSINNDENKLTVLMKMINCSQGLVDVLVLLENC